MGESDLQANGFGPDFRVRKSDEYQAIYNEGKKVITPVIIFFLRYTDLPHARLGLTVSRKVGKAVIRNQIKRKIREAFRRNKDGLAQIDLIASPRKGAKDQPFEAYMDSFTLLMRHIKKKRPTQKEPRP